MENLIIHHFRRRRNLERRQMLLLERRRLRDASNAFELPEPRFIELFRLPQFWVLHLIDLLSPHMTQRTRITGVPAEVRFLAVLNFFATGSYQRSVGQDYNIGLSQSMMSRAIHEVSNIIERNLLNEWVRFPESEAEKTRIKQRFMENTGFPGVCGAIDCTHVAILAPSNEGHNYLNRKGFYSKNVQIISDFDLKILNICARFAGSTHDSYIWRNSVVREFLSQQYEANIRGSWLLGDSGYPLEPWLLTPILDAAVGSPEERYTNCHVRSRVCVERLNGVLKSVFRCLGGDRILRYKPRIAGSIINSCAVLHNMRIHLKLLKNNEEPPINNNVELDDANPIADGQVLQILDEGRRVRDRVVRYFR